MNKPPLYKISATHKRTNVKVQLYFNTIYEAMMRNPYLKDFEFV